MGTILMELLKAYDCMLHKLFIAKVECYGVYKASLRFLLNYFTHRKQWAKIGSSFSSWCDINTGMLQRSIVGTLLFNIFINYLFFVIKIQKYVILQMLTLFSVLTNLNRDRSKVMAWSTINSLGANPRKFQFMVLDANQNDCFNLNVAEVILSSSDIYQLTYQFISWKNHMINR